MKEILSLEVPDQLRQYDQWVAWWLIAGKDRPARLPSGRWTGSLKRQLKPHKLPINPNTGGLAATTRRNTWSSLERALTARQEWGLSGIGYVFAADDPFAGVDIDNCRDPLTGQIADWAWAFIKALDSYTEVSPSGTGIHTIVRGKLPTGQGNQIALQGGKVEMFSQSRYFTVSGVRVEGTPSAIAERHHELIAMHKQLFMVRRVSAVGHTSQSLESRNDDELIECARRARNGLKFERLWYGQWDGDYPSRSEAELALCNILAFWTNNDKARMDLLFQRSGMMRRKWMRKDYREKTLCTAVEGSNCTLNPTDREFRRIVAADNTPWEVPIPFQQFALPEFPTDAFPDWLRIFIESLATATQTPTDLAAMLALSLVAASSAKKAVIVLRKAHVEPLNIFTVVALPSGSRKTTVFNEIVAPLEDYELAESRRSAGQIAESQTTRIIKEARLRKLQDQAANTTGKEQEKLTHEAVTLAGELARTPMATPRRLLADDCTPEKLATLLRDQSGRIAVMSPEGDVFDLMAGRYSATGMSNFGVYLKGHAGDALRIDRVGRPPEFVKAPALTVGLAVQPEVIRGLAEKPGFRGRGLLARFLYSVPKSLLGCRDTDAPSVPNDVRAEYHRNVRGLLSIALQKDENGDSQPHDLTLDEDAQAEFQKFARRVEPQLSEFGELGRMTDWGGKLVGAVGRIAGILHMATRATTGAPWETPIPGEIVANAIRIAEYLIPHAKAAFAEMGADPVVESAKGILRWFEHASVTSCTRRDLHQAMRGSFKRVGDLDRPLDMLELHGYVRFRTDEPQDGPGRPPSPVIDVNPLWIVRLSR